MTLASTLSPRPASSDPSSRSNNFGALRLALAYLVILSHSPELLDGDRSRELLTRLFGTLSFGELAVDCFFIISGYLITSSYQTSASGVEYLAKRVLRIYPGYALAFVLCVFALAPWVGGQHNPPVFGLTKESVVGSIALLRQPASPGAFAAAHYPLLNGAVWTIRYEFLAYLVVLAAGSLGLFSRPRLILAATAALVCAAVLIQATGLVGWPASLRLALLPFAVEFRFLSLFACGSVFYLARKRIVYRGRYAIVAAAALAGLMFSRVAAEAAVATLGSYLLFYFAWHVRSEPLSRIGRKTDLSYGVYLYAWPIQATLVWRFPAMNAWLLFAVASILASAFALMSWVAVERPAMNLKRLLGSRAGRQPAMSPE